MKSIVSMFIVAAAALTCSFSAKAQAVKARPGPWQRDPTAQINANTVTIISGNPNGTYLTIAYDISAVLDNGDKLRILPVVGKGGAQNLRDILYLKGVDMGIVQSDALRYFQENKEAGPAIEQRLRFITKLYNEEMHLLVRADIKSWNDLAGKPVNLSDAGSGSQLTGRFLFRDLGIKIQEVNMGQADAVEQLKSGKIAATLLIGGKPTPVFANLQNNSAKLHFLPLAYSPSLPTDYLPTSLTHQDYPNLIDEGGDVETVAVGAILAVYNWPENTERYRRVSQFVDAFFNNIDRFMQKPRHVKWQETNLLAEVPGWTRVTSARQILGKQIATQDAKLKADFKAFVPTQAKLNGTPQTPAEQEALFEKFKEWQRAH